MQARTGAGSWGVAIAIVATATPTPAPAVPAGEQAAITLALARGNRIFAYDRAAWMTTDAMLAATPETQKSAIRGWVVAAGAGNSLTVTYYGRSGSTPYAIFSADTDGRTVENGRLWPASAPRTLSADLIAQIRARDRASSSGARPCGTERFNTVVLPPETPAGPSPVYLLTPEPAANAYSMGGHYRIEVAANGRIVAQRPFTKSCLTLSAAGGPNGEPSAGLVVSHILDPYPTEIHVFLSLASGLPVYVITGPEIQWKVTGTAIERVTIPG